MEETSLKRLKLEKIVSNNINNNIGMEEKQAICKNIYNNNNRDFTLI